MAASQADSTRCPHDRFYFSDGSLYLSVEDSLYCVHKFLFEIHATMFSVRELETSLNKPYVLGDVKKTDFDCFLASLYPRTLWVEETKTTQDWISVLRLASKWGFESLRSRAIAKIEQILGSPIDMVTLGRQCGIPALLLSGYAVLCQSTAPLSDEEGHRLGLDDVLKIYRIRHELYGSDTTRVHLEVAYEKAKEAGLGNEQPGLGLHSEQASTWTNVGSLTASQIPAGNEEKGPVTLIPNTGPSQLGFAMAKETTIVPESTGQLHVDGRSPSNEQMSSALCNRHSAVPSLILGTALDMRSASSQSAGEYLRLVEELTDHTFDLVSVGIMEWVKTADTQSLYRMTRLIVEKAIEEATCSAGFGPFIRLCKTMLKYNQALRQITGLVVEKAMEESHRINGWAYLCKAIMNDTNVYGQATITADGLQFGEYLGEVCQENLEATAALVAATGEHKAKVRRLRLIHFIKKLGNWMDAWTSDVIEKWMTALLDANDEEKIATLCMLMPHVGHLCTGNGWFERVRNAANETSKPRVRKLLQNVTKDGWLNWS